MKILGILAVALLVSSCGKITLGGSEDDISTDKAMSGCKLDQPVALDNEDLLTGLQLRNVRIDPAVSGLPQEKLVVALFELYSNGVAQGYLGGRLETADGYSMRGFSNDYLGFSNFTGEKNRHNSSMLYKTQMKNGDVVDTSIVVVVKDKKIEGIQLQFPRRGTPTKESDTVCIKSATK